MLLGVAVGAALMHLHDEAHYLSANDFRTIATVTDGAIRLTQPWMRRSSADQFMTGSWNTVVGNCAGTSLTDQNNTLLLGDRTAAPKGDGFVNFGGVVCFWRDAGIRAPCPPPEPDCLTKPTSPPAPVVPQALPSRQA